MKTLMTVVLIFFSTQPQAFANGMKCKSDKRSPVSCEGIKGAKRPFLCVKKGIELKPTSLQKYCLKPKKIYKKNK